MAPTAKKSPGLAEDAPSFRASLCAHQFQLAEPGGALVSGVVEQRIRRGAFFSVDDLKQAIVEFLAAWNEIPNPSSGPRPWSRSWKSCPVAGKPRRKFESGLPVPRSRKERNMKFVWLFRGHYTSSSTLGLSASQPTQGRAGVLPDSPFPGKALNPATMAFPASNTDRWVKRHLSLNRVIWHENGSSSICSAA